MRRIALLFVIALTACATGPTYEAAGNSLFIAANYNAADGLANALKANKQDGPIIVATLANVDNLEQSSRLGRTLSEQVGSRLVQAGFQVIEVKLRNNVFVSNAHQGEFLLSREVRAISENHKVNTVVVGTYSDANEYLYVTVKAVALDSGTITASQDYALPMLPAIRAMLPSPRY